MHPELFTSFGITFKAYSFFTILAALTAAAGGFWLARKRGMPEGKVLLILISMLAASFAGARLLNILISRQAYFAEPALIYSFDFRGFSLYGGALLSVVVALLLSLKLKISPWKLGDALAPFTGIGIALMRLGCFLNGCCFGKISHLPWSVRFPALSPAHIYQISHGESGLLSVAPVHPTQLYELIGALAASGLAVYLLKKNSRDGIAMLTFVIFFTALRWINYSFFRLMPGTFDAPSFFYPLLYFVIIVIGLILLRKRIKS